MIAVNHKGTANLYISNTEGTKYSLSLENVLYHNDDHGKERQVKMKMMVTINFFKFDPMPKFEKTGSTFKKQPPEVYYKKRRSCKIHRKTPVPVSLF